MEQNYLPCATLVGRAPAPGGILHVDNHASCAQIAQTAALPRAGLTATTLGES